MLSAMWTTQGANGRDLGRHPGNNCQMLQPQSNSNFKLNQRGLCLNGYAWIGSTDIIIGRSGYGQAAQASAKLKVCCSGEVGAFRLASMWGGCVLAGRGVEAGILDVVMIWRSMVQAIEAVSSQRPQPSFQVLKNRQKRVHWPTLKISNRYNRSLWLRETPTTLNKHPSLFVAMR